MLDMNITTLRETKRELFPHRLQKHENSVQKTQRPHPDKWLAYQATREGCVGLLHLPTETTILAF